MRILVVEDDASVVEVLSKTLSKESYIVDVALDGETGWQLAASFSYDLILLDMGLPRLDGITFCKRLRSQQNPVLVMLITARDTPSDKLLGLDSGADDYVVKPFNLQELTARIRALLRRGSFQQSSVLVAGDLCLNLLTQEVTYQQKPLRFSRTEHQILELFLHNPNRIYSCAEVGDRLWGLEANPPSAATVRSHIKNIRRQLKSVGAENLIETLYGQGYRLNPTSELADPGSHPQPMTSPSAPSPTTLSDESSVPNYPALLLEQGLREVWQATQSLQSDRITSLETALQALQTNTFDFAIAQAAMHGAHKLAGALGMFGLDQGSLDARRLENLFRPIVEDWPGSEALHPLLLAQAQPLVTRLRQHFSHYCDLAAPTPTPPPSSPLPETPSEPAQAPKAHILVVDDDPQIIHVLRTLLAPLSIQVTGLENPSLFWETLAQAQPDLLILDVNLITANGFDLCQAVRQHPQWNWLPILIFTAQDDPTSAHQAYSLGADDYLRKPIVPQELVIRICNRLQRLRVLQSENRVLSPDAG